MFPSVAARHTLSANIPAFIFVVGWTIALTKLTSYLAPFDLYFTFSSFVFGVGHVRPEALAIKLLIPISAGFLAFYLPARFPSLFARSGKALRRLWLYLSFEAARSAYAAAFFAAIVLAWPVISYWDLLAVPEVRAYRVSFLFIYGLYGLAFGYFASSGVALAKLMLRGRISTHLSTGTEDVTPAFELMKGGLLGASTSALATFFASIANES